MITICILRPRIAKSPCFASHIHPEERRPQRLEHPMTARVMILNGPNLNLIGVREPHIYGSVTFAAIEASCREAAEHFGASLLFHQSNHEGELVDLIQSARQTADALIINPAAYSFTSIAIIDA